MLVFVLALCGFVIGSIIMANITGIPESADMSGYAYLEDNIGMLFLSLAGVYIVSSFGEERIYRGFLINRILELGLNGKIGRFKEVGSIFYKLKLHSNEYSRKLKNLRSEKVDLVADNDLKLFKR